MAYQYNQVSEVQKLINLYRARPDIFESDEIEQLGIKAEQLGINFRPLEQHVNLKNMASQFTGGFIEGMTTLPVAERPRTTYESIARSLGHLAGFAPAIMTVPLKGVAAMAGKVGLKRAQKSISEKAIPRMTKFGEWSLPMIGSRYAKKGVDKIIEKTKLEALDMFKVGGVGKAISKEAIGLGAASVVSNVWHGPDQYINSFTYGAVAGGAFGGIGNFVRLGNVFKNGSPEAIKRAESTLKASLGSMVTGLPATLRQEPVEMQLYEYLLGGFFGYSSRPAFEQAGGKFVNDLRLSENPAEYFQPSKSPRWNDISKKSKEYVNKQATEQSRSWMSRHFPDADLDMPDAEIRSKAYELYTSNRTAFEQEIARKDAYVGDTQEDIMDGYVRYKPSTMSIANDAFVDYRGKEFKNPLEIADDINATIESSKTEGTPNVERFIEMMNDKPYKIKNESIARKFYHQQSQDVHKTGIADLRGDTVSISMESGKVGENVSLGRKSPPIPLNLLSDIPHFDLLTHVLKRVGDRDVYEPLFKTNVSFDAPEKLSYNISAYELYRIQESLARGDKYIFSGVKDKDYAVTTNFIDFVSRDGQNIRVSMEDIYKAFPEESAKILRKMFKESEKREIDLRHGRKGGKIEKEKHELPTDSQIQFLKRLHERKFVSNVLHDAHLNGLYQMYSGDFSNVNRLWGKGYGKNVIDFNKRMQGYVDSGIPQVKESYLDSLPNGVLRTAIIDDSVRWDIPKKSIKELVGGESDTDGGVMFRQEVFDEAVKANGYPTAAGQLKPVIIGRTNLGNLFVKSNAQRADGAIQEYMEANNLDALIFESSAKVRGDIPVNNFKYEGGRYESKDLRTTDIPIEILHFNPSTFEDPVKFSGDIETPLQFGNVLSTLQTDVGTDLFFKHFVEPSILGSKDGIALSLNTGEEIVRKLTKSPKFIDEMPIKFIIDALSERNTETATAVRRAIQNIKPENAEVELDTDKTFDSYHDINRTLFGLADGQYVPNTVLKVLRKPYENSLRKYIIKRYRNPKVKTAGKAWLKAYTPDMLAYADMAPTEVGVRRNIGQGEVLLDDYHRNTPAMMSGKVSTLGKIWKDYLKALKRGDDVSSYEEALTVLAIRTPADSISGVRSLRVKGFTNQRGAGAITHHKDNEYLGGADKDADYISFFQGVPKELRKVYDEYKDDRAHLLKDGGKKMNALKELFRTDQSGIETELASKWSPSMRIFTHKGARKGLQGLGYGLSAKEYLVEVAHQIKTVHGGEYEESYITSGGNNAYIKVKLRTPKEIQEFFDRAYMIVNASADASKYADIKPYSEYRDLLFDALFESEFYIGKNKLRAGYNSLLSPKAENGRGTHFAPIPKLVSTVKRQVYGEPENKFYDFATEIYKSSDKFKWGNIAGKTAKRMQEDGVWKLLQNDLPDIDILIRQAVSNYTKDPAELEFLTKHVSDNLGALLKMQKVIGKTGVNIRGEPFRNMDLDNAGKNLANISAYELINETALDIYKNFLQVDLADTKVLSAELNKIANKALDISKQLNDKAHQNGKDHIDDIANSRYSDLDSEVLNYMEGVIEPFARNNSVPYKSLRKYFELWMLAPYRGRASKRQYDFDRAVWGSDYITNETKSDLMKRMQTIYDTASKGTEGFPKEVLNLEGADLEHFKQALKGFDVDSLDSGINWKQVEFRSGMKQPRLTAYYGDKGTEYTYSGVFNKPMAWTPELLKLKAEVEKITGYTFNSALINKYRTGKDRIGFHKDDEIELGGEPIIASVSFGTERTFKLKKARQDKESFDTKLGHGDIFLMTGETQKNYFHGIDPEKVEGERINITFRNTGSGQIQDRVKTPEPTSYEIKDFTEFTELDTDVQKAVKTVEKIKQDVGFVPDKIRKTALTKEDDIEMNRLNNNLKENPIWGTDFDGMFRDFTLMIERVPRPSSTIQMRDVRAINRYMEDVFSPASKRKGYLPVMAKHWWQDIRTISREHQAFDRKIRDGKALSSFDSMREYMRKMHTQENSEIDKVISESDKMFGFRKNMGVEDRTTLMRIITARRAMRTEEGIGFQMEQAILNDPKAQAFLKKTIRGRKGEYWAEFYDRKFTKFFEEFGKEWIWTLDAKGNKFSWQDWDAKPTYGKVTEHLHYDKNGRLDFNHFLKKVIKPVDSNKPAPKIGLEQLLRFQYEYILETKLAKEGRVNKKAWRESYRKAKATKFKAIGRVDSEAYFPRIDHGYSIESIRLRDQSIELMAIRARDQSIASGGTAEEAQTQYNKVKSKYNYFIDSSLASTTHLEKGFLDYMLEGVGFNNRPQVALERSDDYIAGYNREASVIDSYKGKFIRSYFKALASIQGNNRIDRMIMDKPFDIKVPKKHLKELKKAGYSSQSEVWGDYLKLYLRDSLGHPSRLTPRIINSMKEGDPLSLKKSPYYFTSDYYIAKQLEKKYSSLAKKKWDKYFPFLNNVPKETKAREDYFIRKVHDLGHLEAKYNLLTLLANTGSLVSNIYGGAEMTIANAGFRNFVKSKSDKVVTERLLTNDDGTWALTYKGKPVTNRKELLTWLIDKGVIDSYIANEFDYNPKLAESLGLAGKNGKDFIREVKKVLRKNPETKDETLRQLAKRYGISDAMVRYGAAFMQYSERVNRIDAFLAHALQGQDNFSVRGKTANLSDSAIFEAGMKGIEVTQFLYHSAFRPAFMRTATGKVMSRFKLFAFQSVRTRKEFYKQAKYYGFEEGTQAYNRFKDLFLMDLFTFALGSMFAYSLFDTTLAPPWDWVQETSEWLFGDKQQRDRAFFGVYPYPIAPLQIITPPIARIPQAFAQLINGDWDRFADYTVHTMYPFGRLYKQFQKTAEDPKRILENFMRLPANKLMYRYRSAKKDKRRRETIERILG